MSYYDEVSGEKMKSGSTIMTWGCTQCVTVHTLMAPDGFLDVVQFKGRLANDEFCVYNPLCKCAWFVNWA